jgi:hypothetical protein
VGLTGAGTGTYNSSGPGAGGNGSLGGSIAGSSGQNGILYVWYPINTTAMIGW